MVDVRRFRELYQAVDDENISYGEIVELEEIANKLKIDYTEEMVLADLVLEIQDKLTEQTRHTIDHCIDEWLILQGVTDQQIGEMNFSFIDDELNNLARGE